jgi:hypothetical protein
MTNVQILCGRWSFPPINAAAAEQKATPPPPMTIGRRAAAADGQRA